MNARMRERNNLDDDACLIFDDYGDGWALDEKSIQESYSLDNIK